MLYTLPNLQTKAQAVVLANGNFPTHPIPLAVLENNRNNIICCDGAINNLINTDLIPEVIIGDCDSLSDDNKVRYADKIYKIEEQDTNDLTKTILYCKKQQINDLIILGATGKREDHTIGNISLLTDYIDTIDKIAMITDYGIFNAIKTTSCFESFSGQQVSLFNVGDMPITTRGLKYGIENKIYKKWWQATLNEAIAESFEIITLDKIIIYRAFKQYL